MGEVLVAKGISRRLCVGNKQAFSLNDVSLTLRRGELAALQGHSGSGKTTFLQIAGLLLEPDAGRLDILGRDTAAMTGAQRAVLRAAQIGFVFQAFNLLPQLTAEQNVMLATGRWGRETRLAANQLLDRLGIEHRAHHHPGEMSAGEQQRVAVARAIVNQPALLLADEPTGNLDDDNEQLLLNFFEEYARSGHAVLVVTHSDRVAGRAGRILRIEAGSLTAAEGRD